MQETCAEAEQARAKVEIDFAAAAGVASRMELQLAGEVEVLQRERDESFGHAEEAQEATAALAATLEQVLLPL